MTSTRSAPTDSPLAAAQYVHALSAPKAIDEHIGYIRKEQTGHVKNVSASLKRPCQW